MQHLLVYHSCSICSIVSFNHVHTHLNESSHPRLRHGGSICFDGAPRIEAWKILPKDQSPENMTPYANEGMEWEGARIKNLS